nr:proteoglycan 4-like isoform X1 [Ipomoea batatas]
MGKSYSRKPSPENDVRLIPRNRARPTPRNRGKMTARNCARPTPRNRGKPTPKNRARLTPRNHASPTPRNRASPTLGNRASPTLGNRASLTPWNRASLTPWNRASPTFRKRASFRDFAWERERHLNCYVASGLFAGQGRQKVVVVEKHGGVGGRSVNFIEVAAIDRRRLAFRFDGKLDDNGDCSDCSANYCNFSPS